MLNRPLQLSGAALMALLATVATANATTGGGGGGIPEPSLAVLLAVGVGGVILYGRSRRGRR